MLLCTRVQVDAARQLRHHTIAELLDVVANDKHLMLVVGCCTPLRCLSGVIVLNGLCELLPTCIRLRGSQKAVSGRKHGL